MGGVYVQVFDVVIVGRELVCRFDLDNFLVDDQGYVFYVDIDQIEEMIDMMLFIRSFEISVEVFNCLKQVIEGC